MALRSKFVASYGQKHGLTHFIAIPLVTPTSIMQVSDSFKCLWDDLAAIGVRNDAIRPLGLLHLSLDITLSLKTPERMAKAREILGKIPIKEIQPTIHESSTSGNLSRHSSSALPTSNYDTDNSMSPPSVSISSLLHKQPGKEAEAFKLSTLVHDPTHRLRNWKARLAHTLQAAGLSPKPRATSPQMRAALGAFDSIVCLVDIPFSTKVVPYKWDPEKLTHTRLYSFDARGLLERYKDHVWMENAPLERVSICKIGFRRLGAKELQEVVSIPLY